MKAALFFILLFSVPARAAAPASPASPCESVEHARKNYSSGNSELAYQELKCLKKKNPKSVDLRRTLSDFYWWDDSAALSSGEAREGLALIQPAQFSLNEETLHLSDRIHPLTIRGNFQTLSADHSTGQNYSLELDDRYAGKNHFSLGAYRTERLYTGNVDVSDWRYEAGHLWAIGKSFYWENKVSYSPEAKISAQYGVATVPHWIFSDSSDVSFGVRFSHYTSPNDVLTLNPAWSRFIGEQLLLGVQIYSMHTEHWIYAAQGSATYLFHPRAHFRASYAFGHAVEGPGLEGSFGSLNLELAYRITERWSVIPNYGRYRGSVRNENAYGISVELKL